jgi:hypothetical protein
MAIKKGADYCPLLAAKPSFWYLVGRVLGQGRALDSERGGVHAQGASAKTRSVGDYPAVADRGGSDRHQDTPHLRVVYNRRLSNGLRTKSSVTYRKRSF